MDQIKPKQAEPPKPAPKPLSIVESYQRQWDQLMEDTNKQIDKIRLHSMINGDATHLTVQVH
ncbi:hypothetical protein N7523_011010 [Penicillium sp. IBT 18751x]|nr:hypothetical protein N7523_011010 [Penicillium sp. IBT 18751x]